MCVSLFHRLVDVRRVLREWKHRPWRNRHIFLYVLFICLYSSMVQTHHRLVKDKRQWLPYLPDMRRRGHIVYQMSSWGTAMGQTPSQTPCTTCILQYWCMPRMTFKNQMIRVTYFDQCNKIIILLLFHWATLHSMIKQSTNSQLFKNLYFVDNFTYFLSEYCSVISPKMWVYRNSFAECIKLLKKATMFWDLNYNSTASWINFTENKDILRSTEKSCRNLDFHVYAELYLSLLSRTTL